MKIAMCFYGELRSLEFLNSDYTSNTHFDFFISAGTGKYNSDDINIDFKYSNFELDKVNWKMYILIDHGAQLQ